MPENNPLPGWYRDPSGLGEGRYWDGVVWTNSVSRSGATIEVPIEPERAALPPIPGSELRTPAPVVASPTATVPQTRRSPLGAIIGVIGAILIIVLIVVLINNGSESPNDETPPATNPTEAPATEAPAAPDTTG
jgi:hypothetical protein